VSTAAHAVGRTDANSQIKLAAIGVGGRGNYLLNQFAAHDDVAITVLCDVNEKNLARAAESVRQIKGAKPRMVADFQRVLDDKSVDAVIIATDDERIRLACEAFGAEVEMTRKDHPTGTDRLDRKSVV
jgi:predicted dehydrogenase